MNGLAKLAAYTPIEEGENLARRNEEYYDHTHGSTKAGGVVGAASGVVGGGLAGYGAGKTMKRLNTLAQTNKKFRTSANIGLANLGFEGSDIRDITSKFPKTKTATKIGLGAGLAAGGLMGAYKGMMTGVGLNDRQYLLQRNIEPHELVDNSAMASMQMSGPSLNPMSPIINQAFGAQIGGLRRAQLENTKDGSLHEKE